MYKGPEESAVLVRHTEKARDLAVYKSRHNRISQNQEPGVPALAIQATKAPALAEGLPPDVALTQHQPGGVVVSALR